MKKNLLFLGLASAMLAFAGCTKDVTADSGIAPEKGAKAPLKLSASVMNSDGTRMEFGNQMSMVWSEDDAIGVFSHKSTSGGAGADNANNVYYALTSGAGSALGQFTVGDGEEEYALTQTPFGKYTEDPTTPTTYVAVYPQSQFACSTYGIDAGSFRVGAVVPYIQDYVPNAFPKDAVPMISVFNKKEGSEDYEDLKFKFLGAMLHLKVKSPSGAGTVNLSKVEVLPNYSGSLTPRFSGTVYALFPNTAYYGNTGAIPYSTVMDAYRNDITKVISSEFRYLEKDPASVVNSVTLQSTAAHTIQLNETTATDLYMGIIPDQLYIKSGGTHPNALNSGGITLSFYYEDGSMIQKLLNSTKSSGVDSNGNPTGAQQLEPGMILNIPEFTLETPYRPVLTINAADTSAVIKDIPECVHYLSLVYYLPDGSIIPIEGTDRKTIPMYSLIGSNTGGTPISVNDDKFKFRPKFADFAAKVDGVGIPYGTTGNLKAVLRADIVETVDGKSVYSVAYSAPVAFSYTAGPRPDFTTTLTPNVTWINVKITNGGGYQTYEYAIIPYKENATESDFSGLTLTKITNLTNTNITKLSTASGSTGATLVGGTQYSILLRATPKEGEPVVRVLQGETSKPDLSKCNCNGGSFYWSDFKTVMGYYQPTSCKLYWETAGTAITEDSSSWDILTTYPGVPTTVTAYYNNIMGDEFVADGRFDFKIVLKYGENNELTKEWKNLQIYSM